MKSSRTKGFVRPRVVATAFALATALPLLTAVAADGERTDAREHSSSVTRGKQIFRFDTFGDELFWSDGLRMHEVVNGVAPTTALAVGLKVDAEALPPEVLAALRDGVSI